jgi:hypothetical protein
VTARMAGHPYYRGADGAGAQFGGYSYTVRMLSTVKFTGSSEAALILTQLTDVPLRHRFGLRWRPLMRLGLAASYIVLMIVPAWRQATAKPDDRHSHQTSVHRHFTKAAKDDAGRRQTGEASLALTMPALGKVLAAPDTSAPVRSVKPLAAPLDAAAGTGSMTVSATAAPKPDALPTFISSSPVTNDGARTPTLAESETSPSALVNVMLLSGMAGGALAIAIGAARAARHYIASRRTPAPRCEVEDGGVLMPLRGLVFGGGRDRRHGRISG